MFTDGSGQDLTQIIGLPIKSDIWGARENLEVHKIGPEISMNYGIGRDAQ